jgi:hypothetical protein
MERMLQGYQERLITRPAANPPDPVDFVRTELEKAQELKLTPEQQALVLDEVAAGAANARDYVKRTEYSGMATVKTGQVRWNRLNGPMLLAVGRGVRALAKEAAGQAITDDERQRLASIEQQMRALKHPGFADSTEFAAYLGKVADLINEHTGIVVDAARRYAQELDGLLQRYGLAR